MKTVYRKEFKYFLPANLVEEFKRAIAPHVTIDEYARAKRGNRYTVRSIYYDTNNFMYYNEKVDGICNRKKVRIRVYDYLNEESITFLEIKRKYEDSQIKNRSKLLFSDLEVFLKEKDTANYIFDKFSYIENANRFLYLLNRYSLQPQTLVVYDREPFFTKFDSTTRITIDHNLRKADKPGLNDIFRDDILTPVMIDRVILEVKFYKGYSQWIQKVIEDFGLTRLAISKYMNCLDDPGHKRINIARHRLFRKQLTY